MSKLDNLADALAKPDIEYRPEQRWWLASGHHTMQTLKHEVKLAYEMGFGGMEFLAMDEAGIDNERYAWGSEQWTHSSNIVAEETTARGMSISFTSGTNWANANLPTINPEHPAAAKELNFVIEDVIGGQSRQGVVPSIDLEAYNSSQHIMGHKKPVAKQNLVAVVAAKLIESDKTGGILDVATIDLTRHVHGDNLEWTAPQGDHKWRLFYFYQHGTGQHATPSASVNYTINYLDPEGIQEVIKYWDTTVLTPKLRSIIASNKRAQMYMDSLELLAFGSGGLLWGHSVASEFEKRHGYSIVPYLPFMVCAAPMMASSTKWKYDPVVAVEITTVRKVRFDLLHTFTDLYIEHTLRPFRTYLNSVGIQLRAEISYGLPFELSRPGTEVDGIETESLEFGSQIDGYRLLAGVAHTFGKQFSSETGAVARNHINSHQFYDQIMATQFAAGISKTVLHGWASVAGAPGTEWPGHEGMWAIFGERFDARQPGSDFYSLWCQAMGRIQYLLRQGKPRIDVAILRTDHLVDNTCGIATKGDDGFVHVDEEVYENWWMRNRQNFWWQDLGMQDAGWSYEFLDGELLLRPEISFAEGLLQPGGPGYQAVIIYQDSLNPDVAKQLVRWARGGLRILLVDNVAELVLLRERRYHKNAAAASSTQGLDGRDEELAETIETLLSLPNARRITDPRDTMSTLVELGVRGRAEFVEPDINILTHLRDDGDVQHLYLYHFLYKNGSATDVTVSLDGAWEVQRVDHWSGRILDDVESNHADGRTTATLRMHPGQVTVLTTRRVAGTSVSSKNSANQRTMAVTGDWDLTVEDWDAGESEVITEDRGLGYVTKEERPVTKKTMIHVGETALLPWLQLEAVGPQVSGIGTYKTQIHLPSDFNTSKPSQLCLGSTCGGLGSVAINDTTAQGFDTSVPIIDTTDLFRPGANEVTVKVSTSLNNRLLSRGYYDSGHGPFLGGDFDPKYPAHAPRDYGLLGPVEVKYTT